MSDPTLRKIKEEIRLAVIYYGVDAFDRFGKVNKFKEFMTSTPTMIDEIYLQDASENAINLRIISENEVRELSGRVAMTEVLTGTGGGYSIFCSIKDMIYEHYKVLGYADLAKKAKNQVQEDYIYAGLRKYGINSDEKDYRHRLSHRIKKSHEKLGIKETDNNANDNSEKPLIWMIIFGICFVVISLIAGLFVDIDTRTDAQKVQSAYCAKQGKTC